MARTKHPSPGLPNRCFVSHAYTDAAVLADMQALLPPDVELDVFPWEDPNPERAVSDGIVERIRASDGLIYLRRGASQESGWVFFERDFALRAGKPVFSFDPASGDFRDETRAPQKLEVTLLSAEGRAAERAERIQRWMKERRGFRIASTWLPSRMDEMASFFSDLARWRQLTVWLLDGKGAAVLSFLDEVEFDDSDGPAPRGWWPPPVVAARVDTDWEKPSHPDPFIDLRLQASDDGRRAVDLVEGAGRDGIDWNQVDLLIVRILLALHEIEQEHFQDALDRDAWDDEED